MRYTVGVSTRDREGVLAYGYLSMPCIITPGLVRRHGSRFLISVFDAPEGAEELARIMGRMTWEKGFIRYYPLKLDTKEFLYRLSGDAMEHSLERPGGGEEFRFMVREVSLK